MGRFTEAVADFQVALSAGEDDRQALYGLSQTYLRWGDRSQGQAAQARFVSAKRTSDELLERYIDWPQSWGLRGYVRSRLAKTQAGLRGVLAVFDQACRDWEQGYRRDPTYVDALRGLANTRLQQALFLREARWRGGLEGPAAEQASLVAARASLEGFERAIRVAQERGERASRIESLRQGAARARALTGG